MALICPKSMVSRQGPLDSIASPPQSPMRITLSFPFLGLPDKDLTLDANVFANQYATRTVHSVRMVNPTIVGSNAIGRNINAANGG